jgi:mannitol 2-dehydrogenase
MEIPGPLLTVPEAVASPQATTVPHYDRKNLGCGIAHLGMGNFHRAHQALFLHQYLQTRPQNWMVHGIGTLESDRPLVQAMNSQDNLYTLTERSGTEDTLKIIGSIKKVSHAPSDPAGIVRLLASNEIKIISLTVTEKGYCYNAAGELDLNHPMIKADLAKDSLPKSALGFLFEAARQRMLNRGEPVTVMSCDNLPGNGDLTKSLLLQFAVLKVPEVGDWIINNMAFPNAMVDRITPATTPKTLAFVRDTFGVADACPVQSETFIQWVLEDHFINGRPALEAVGVQFTGSVEPYEKLKMRLLNGSHSALAYAGYLMGFREVDVAMNEPLIHRFLQHYMDDDITPTLPEVPGIDVTAYKQTLLQRFSNPAISDQVPRLTLDGSPKIRNVLVPPLEQQLASGGSIKWMAFTLAAWYRYLNGQDEKGDPIEVLDPMSERLVALANTYPRDASKLLAVQEIFGSQLASNDRLVNEVQARLDAIWDNGTRQALARALSQ